VSSDVGFCDVASVLCPVMLGSVMLCPVMLGSVMLRQ
jgi:hypothetical protein